jgi:hypothetical protein
VIREKQAKRMAEACLFLRISPSEYRQLTLLELNAFVEQASPQTDLTGLL